MSRRVLPRTANSLVTERTVQRTESEHSRARGTSDLCQRIAACGLTVLVALSCDRSLEPAEKKPAASSARVESSAESAAAQVPVGIPVDPAEVAKVVNPNSAKPYAGPTGTVRGTVRLTGDPVPRLQRNDIPARCSHALDMYQSVLREGIDRAVADALVAVTGYSGYVPAASPARRIQAQGCAFETRTVALTLGQKLEISVNDNLGYAPRLVGARQPAQLIPIPGGAPTPLYPEKPGRYVLTDQAHPFMHAEVFVLKYPTFDVSGLDGKFEIAGIPAGEVTVTAFLPAIAATAEKRIKLTPGQTQALAFEIPFDRKRWQAQRKATTQAGEAKPKQKP